MLPHFLKPTYQSESCSGAAAPICPRSGKSSPRQKQELERGPYLDCSPLNVWSSVCFNGSWGTGPEVGLLKGGYTHRVILIPTLGLSIFRNLKVSYLIPKLRYKGTEMTVTILTRAKLLGPENTELQAAKNSA